MEQNVRKCKVCTEEKLRILSGRFPNKKDKQWVGVEGKLWNGNVCPQCHQIRVAEQTKEKRAKIKSI